MAAAAVIVVMVVAGVWLHSRALAALASDLLDRSVQEREQWHRERQLLLNRIKPETAQAVADPTLEPGPMFRSAVPYDDDEAFWESKEQMADRLAREEVMVRVDS